MKISIITVCYNSADTIIDTLNSVAEQTYPDIEYIIIDGGSTDGTLEIIRQHKVKFSKLIVEPDEGVYDAYNKGWKLATGDVVAYLNSDDNYMHKNVLQEVADTMADPNMDACYGDLIYVDRVDTSKLVRYWQGSEHHAGDCLKGWMPAYPTFFVRRALFERCGGFDLRYPRQADFELTLRWFEQHKIRSRYVPKIWTRMRMGGLSNNSITGIIKGNMESYRACLALGYKVTPLFVARKILSRVPQYWRRPDKNAA